MLNLLNLYVMKRRRMSTNSKNRVTNLPKISNEEARKSAIKDIANYEEKLYIFLQPAIFHVCSADIFTGLENLNEFGRKSIV